VYADDECLETRLQSNDASHPVPIGSGHDVVVPHMSAFAQRWRANLRCHGPGGWRDRAQSRHRVKFVAEAKNRRERRKLFLFSVFYRLAERVGFEPDRTF
jgi:hypothetical protein